jgi:hypothetical protein
MGLVICADCGRDVSDRAAACPQCGRPAPVDALPVVEDEGASRDRGLGNPALLLMGAGGLILLAGFVLLVRGDSAWASAALLTGVVLGVAGRLAALLRRR